MAKKDFAESLIADDFLKALLEIKGEKISGDDRDPLKILARKIEHACASEEAFALVDPGTRGALEKAVHELFPTKRRKTANVIVRLKWFRKKLRVFHSLTEQKTRDEVHALCLECYNQIPLSSDNPVPGATSPFSTKNEPGHALAH
ncbi:MAG TPA: hypothetical protein VMU25_04840 [Candidatus Paceibacterota bacterium]|nr:hypothetical protein [Candidatus Paceibacterota bacterium]